MKYWRSLNGETTRVVVIEVSDEFSPVPFVSRSAFVLSLPATGAKALAASKRLPLQVKRPAPFVKALA